MIEKVAEQVFIPLTVGGGVREVEDVRRLLNAGADKVSINTAAVMNPDLVAAASSRFGSQCIVVAIDARCRQKSVSEEWEVYTHGGRKSTGLDALAWGMKMQLFGAGEILLTSMDRDGTKNGFDLELTAAMSKKLDIPVIASGGVGKIIDFLDGINVGLADALLAASVFHFGEIKISEVKKMMSQNGIPVRL